MRYADYIKSPYAGVYKAVASWCNQPSFFKKMSLREFCTKSGGVRLRYITQLESDFPEFGEYYDIKWKGV